MQKLWNLIKSAIVQLKPRTSRVSQNRYKSFLYDFDAIKNPYKLALLENYEGVSSLGFLAEISKIFLALNDHVENRIKSHIPDRMLKKGPFLINAIKSELKVWAKTDLHWIHALGQNWVSSEWIL